MHALTMYSVSMRDISASTPDNRTGIVNIRKAGIYKHIIEFLKTYTNGYHRVNGSDKSVIHIDPDWIKENGDFISGYIEYGHYGVPGKLVNIKTNAKHAKTKNDSDIYHLYFCIYLPTTADSGIALFHKIHNTGVKTVFESEFNNVYVKAKNIGLKLNIRPITTSAVASDYMENAKVKQLVFERFTAKELLGDVVDGLPEDATFDIVIKAKRGGFLGTLSDYQAKKQDAKYAKNIVMANDLCGKVKSKINIDGSNRTTELANEGTESRIIVTEADVKMNDNLPQYESFNEFAEKLAKQLLKEMGK
jgi:hypothetical protein